MLTSTGRVRAVRVYGTHFSIGGFWAWERLPEVIYNGGVEWRLHKRWHDENNPTTSAASYLVKTRAVLKNTRGDAVLFAGLNPTLQASDYQFFDAYGQLVAKGSGLPQDGVAMAQGPPAAGRAGVFRLGMTSKPWDPDAKLYHFGFRERGDGSNGFVGWLQEEPLGLDGPNMYQHVHGDPVNGVDLDGLLDARAGEPEWHHLIPRQFFGDGPEAKAFYQRHPHLKGCIDINAQENGLEIARGYHRTNGGDNKLHPSWNAEWKRWIDDKEALGHHITVQDVIGKRESMLKDSKFAAIIAEAGAVPASGSYADWSSYRFSKYPDVFNDEWRAARELEESLRLKRQAALDQCELGRAARSRHKRIIIVGGLIFLAAMADSVGATMGHLVEDDYGAAFDEVVDMTIIGDVNQIGALVNLGADGALTLLEAKAREMIQPTLDRNAETKLHIDRMAWQ